MLAVAQAAHGREHPPVGSSFVDSVVSSSGPLEGIHAESELPQCVLLSMILEVNAALCPPNRPLVRVGEVPSIVGRDRHDARPCCRA